MSKRKCVMEYIVIATITIVLVLTAIYVFGKVITNQCGVADSAVTGVEAGAASVETQKEARAMQSGSKFTSPSFKGRSGIGVPRQVGASTLIDDSVIPPDGGSSASEFFSATNTRPGACCRPGGFDDDF